jgi:hypothetical protein
MRKIAPPTEPCAGCGRPTEVTRWTERSRSTGKPFCDRYTCRPAGASWLETSPAQLLNRGSARVADPGADARAFAFLDQIDARQRAAAARLGLTPEEAREELQYRQEAADLDMSYEEYRAAIGGAEDEYRDAAVEVGGAEFRGFALDGTALYGREPDGVPRVGRAYRSRWWAPEPRFNLRAALLELLETRWAR